MGIEAKQLKNSEGDDMVLRILRAALGEVSLPALLGLMALAAEELKKRCITEIVGKLHSENTRQTG